MSEDTPLSEDTGNDPTCTHTQQLIVKSYGQHTYIEAMKSSQPEFYANASLSSQVLCLKHYISMYLGEYPAKL